MFFDDVTERTDILWRYQQDGSRMGITKDGGLKMYPAKDHKN